jgi:leucyl aminopeptidase
VATVTLSSSDPLRAKGDALVVGTAITSDGVALARAADLPDGLLATLRLLGATGKAGEVVRTPAPDGVAAGFVLATGLGRFDETAVGDGTGSGAAERSRGHEALRRAAGVAARTLAGTKRAVVALPGERSPGAVGAVVEGLRGGAYEFTRFRSAPGSGPLQAAVVHTPIARQAGGRDALHRATVVADAVAAVRDLVNTPPGDLPPAEVAAVAKGWADEHGLDVEVLDERALRRGGYGGILGVGQGSTRPPRLVRLSYRPARPAAHLALVGKGITFDSGGLSIKPGEAMKTMKCDMAGAASVLAATVAVARLRLPLQVTTYAPLAENMPSGAAIRPGDVLVAHGGKTIEVLNTDAEGRLVLADALVRACADGPDVVLDVATLTGACVVALGQRYCGLMTDDDRLRARIPELATDAGDLFWPLPLPEEMRELLDSTVADIKNVGDRWGGAMQAATFLHEFVTDDVRWAHVDIAGPAFNTGGAYGRTPRGGTGVAVPTLVRLAEAMAAGDL